MKYEFLNRKVMMREHYQNTIDAIAGVLQREAGDRVSFLIYGSTLDDRLIPGLSDIDAVLFFWNDYVLDSALLARLGEKMRNAFSFLHPDSSSLLDVAIIDAGHARDGRFIPYNDNFAKVFDPENGDSKVVHGKNFIDILRPVELIDPIEARLAFNLQTLRIYLLFGRCNFKAVNGVNPIRELHVLQQVRSIARKVVMLVSPDMKLAKSKCDCLRALKEYLPDVSLEPLFEIENLFENREAVIDILFNGDAMPFLVRSLECYENILRYIVEKFPAKSFRQGGEQCQKRVKKVL